MGTCWFLIKLDRYEYFDLGKQLGHTLNADDKPFLLDGKFRTPTDLGSAFEKAFVEGFFADDLKKNAFIEGQTLAAKLFDWAKWDRLILRTDNSTDGLEYDLKKYNAFTSGEWWDDEIRQGRWRKTGSF